MTGPGEYTVVYTGQLDGTGSTMTITFDTPYEYGGDNLLIGAVVISSGSYSRATFYGVTQSTNTAWYRSSSTGSGTAQQFLPKTTFVYTPATTSGPTCARVSGVNVTDITPSSATINWTIPDGQTATYSIMQGETLLGTTTSNSYTLTGLSASTPYAAHSARPAKLSLHCLSARTLAVILICHPTHTMDLQ